jgi:pimeloyl-ACP methyl ester carboxylesterase
MSPRWTVVLVPGAWHSPKPFEDVGNILKASKYKVKYVTLASVGANPPLENFNADVEAIQSVLQSEVGKGQKIVLVVHSYGGLPGCEAVKGFDLATRKQEGKIGGVGHIFFCASFVIDVHKSLIGAFGGNDLPWFDVSEDKTTVRPKTPKEIFYNDLDKKTADEWVNALEPHSYQTFYSPLTYAAWKHVPSTYLYCLQDVAIPLHIQKMMVEETAKGVDFKTDTLNAGHSPFLSMPEEMAKSIRRAAGEEL